MAVKRNPCAGEYQRRDFVSLTTCSWSCRTSEAFRLRSGLPKHIGDYGIQRQIAHSESVLETILFTGTHGYELTSIAGELAENTKTTRQRKVSFNCNHCVGCPYQGQCRPKIDGWNATFITSKNASNRAKSQRYMQSEEFSNYAKLRNGVETVPANIRKNYRLDKLPRGKQRGKFFFGSKIAALNFRKLFGFRKGLVNYAQNPIFG